MEGCDINQEDFAGTIPLLWAAWNGHDGVVEILLGWGDISPGKQDNFGGTPLRYASEYSYAGVVNILLERDEVNPDKLDVSGLTPLWSAAWNGNEGVVKMLLERDDVDPNKLDLFGETALWCASMREHAGVVPTAPNIGYPLAWPQDGEASPALPPSDTHHLCAISAKDHNNSINVSIVAIVSLFSSLPKPPFQFEMTFRGKPLSFPCVGLPEGLSFNNFSWLMEITCDENAHIHHTLLRNLTNFLMFSG